MAAINPQPSNPPAAASQQPVVLQPQQPVIIQQPPSFREAPVQENAEGVPVLRIYSHSNLVYWWPVWAVGFLMALLSYVDGRQYQVGDAVEYFHPSSDLGIMWLVTLLLVILITNVPARGLASGMILLAIAFMTVLLAYLHLWDDVLRLLGNLSVHLNLGAYMFIAAPLFVVWVLTVFVFDHLNYWEVTPGQLTRIKVFGAGQVSYDTENMVLERFRNDVFRHWILGLGSGDLRVFTGTQNRQQQLDIPNVFFVGHKMDAFQRMIATRPDSFRNPEHRL